MFDVGFLELILIGLVALLVLGPTKMIELARITGRWAGKLRHQFNDIKADIDRELEVDEMRRKLAEEEKKLREEMAVKPVDLNPQPTIHQNAEPASPSVPASAPASASEPATETTNQDGKKVS